jgi:hypothetical protein
MASLPHQERANLSTNFSATPRHRLLEFGDGYIQRTPLGLHHTRRRVTVTHSAMDLQEGDDVVDFYEARLSDGAAIDIAANYLFNRAGKFYLESFEVSMDDDARRSISASMIEVFDL